MKRAKHETPLFAVCINNTEYPASLDLHKLYRVIADEDAAQDGDIRVIDESGEDYYTCREIRIHCWWPHKRTPCASSVPGPLG
jgi:hypothetical protein